MPENTVPPKWILFLLWPFKGEPCYPQIEGDLAEEFQQRTAESGSRAARLWFYKEIFRNIWFLTFRWITVATLILPLFVMVPYFFLAKEYSLWAHRYKTGYLVLSWDFIFFGLSGLLLGTICSWIISKHERMVRLSFSFYYLAYVGLANVGMALNVWRGFRVTGLIYLNFVIRISWPFIWTLVLIWVGSNWIERNRRFREEA